MIVLITGGAGYIGSTIASACIDAGHEPIIIDNLSRGSRAATTGRTFYEGDIADEALLRHIHDKHGTVDAVVHCAALIDVPESVRDPLRYYDNNVARTTRMLETLIDLGWTRIIFSSSASVYGTPVNNHTPDDLAVTEQTPLAPHSPYARTKAMVEDILRDSAQTGLLTAMALRYFNPTGVDPQHRTGPTHSGPKNVLDKLVDAHLQHRSFTVAGTDWPSRDGTAVRDYVHVWDLALAHLAALNRITTLPPATFEAINIGTGTGTTVRELVTAFQHLTGHTTPIIDGPRRPGDILGGYAGIDLAKTTLNWAPQLGVDDSILSLLTWRTSAGQGLALPPGPRVL